MGKYLSKWDGSLRDKLDNGAFVRESKLIFTGEMCKDMISHYDLATAHMIHNQPLYFVTYLLTDV